MHHHTSMLHPLFGAKDVCYIEKKVGTKKAILGAASLYIVLIYTPKEVHSQIFVAGGSVFARQMLAKKKLVLARRACILL